MGRAPTRPESSVFEFPPATREGPAEPIDLGVVTPGWQPVIARDKRPVGFRLVLRAGDGASVPMADLLDGLLGGFIADDATGFPHGLIVLAPVDLPLDDSMAAWSAPRNVLLEIDQDELADAVRLRRVQEIQRRGVRLVLRVSDGARLADARLPLFQYVAMQAGTQGLAPRECALLALGPGSSAGVSAAFKAGAHAVVGWPLGEAAQGASGTLQPMQRAVLDLIRLVQAEAENRDLERAFRAEPMLSYMLLTLANSPAFVRGRPIASIAQAIQLLGYQRLVKWLVLLMVVAAKETKALPQIYTAVARGFLMENLAGAAGVRGRERDESFIVGVFSLLDKIVGRDASQLFGEVPLPPAVVAALVERTGPFARYLGLALALEGGDAGIVQAGTSALQLSQGAVNQALLQALAATDALQSVV
ncbi:MAG TPA: HDOD domain-containing protein [Burkholderiaceae bacterium]|nr:HDOD domain-containing protein [Burkholderiaceae bacterium]